MATDLILKRLVLIKAIVTPRWKEEMQQQLQSQINQIDSQLQQIEMQGQRAIAEFQKQPMQTNTMQQIENIQAQVNQKKSELLEQKNQCLQELQQVQIIDLNQEVVQAQVEGFFRVEKGDNLIQKMQVEILLRDGIVEDIRGNI